MGAPAAYKALVLARDKAAPGSPEVGRDAERGLEVAVGTATPRPQLFSATA